MFFLHRGKDGENGQKWLSLLGGTFLFFIVFMAAPNIAQGMTGVNINTNPADYRLAATTKDAQGNYCTTTEPGYDPANQQQFNDCSSVALFGLKTATTAYTMINTVKTVAVIGATLFAMVGGVMFRLQRQLIKTPIV